MFAKKLLALLLVAACALGTPLTAQYAQPLDDPNYADAQENVFLRDEITCVMSSTLSL